MKKKLLVLMMLVFSLTACNADKDKTQEPQKTEQTQEQAKTDENKTEEKAADKEADKDKNKATTKTNQSNPAHVHP